MTRDVSDVPLRLYAPGERRAAAPREYIIGDVLCANEALLMIGGPKSGKSALAVAAAHAVSTGADFFGHRVRRGAVVYVPAERFAETDLRLEMAIRDEAALPPVRLSRASIYADEHSVDRLAAAVRALGEDEGCRPALVIFDTAAALLREAAGDENSARDIGKLTLAIDRLRDLANVAVIVIAHAKRGERRSRGSEALEAWADSVSIVEEKGRARRLSIIRSNTIEEGLKATFELRPIDLGTDVATGAKSAVGLAMPLDASTASPTPRVARLAPDVEAAFTQLRKLDAPITLDNWRSAVMDVFASKESGARRQAFLHAKKTLEFEGFITIDGQSVSVSVSEASA